MEHVQIWDTDVRFDLTDTFISQHLKLDQRQFYQVRREMAKKKSAAAKKRAADALAATSSSEASGVNGINGAASENGHSDE